MTKIFPILLFTLILTACSPDGANDQDLQEQIGTEVAQAMAAAKVSQTSQAAKTMTAIKSATPPPSTTSTPTLTETPTFTKTASPSPTATSTPKPTSTQTPTDTPIGYIPENAIFFYATAIGTGGNVGCGDDLVKLYSGHIRSGDTATDLSLALNTLFASGAYPGGLYNATYPSNLWVQDVLLDGGTAKVYLDGNYVVPKDSCDASRYRAQVWATGRQFKEVTHFIPFVGSKLLGDRLAIYSDGGG